MEVNILNVCFGLTCVSRSTFSGWVSLVVADIDHSNYDHYNYKHWSEREWEEGDSNSNTNLKKLYLHEQIIYLHCQSR